MSGDSPFGGAPSPLMSGDEYHAGALRGSTIKSHRFLTSGECGRACEQAVGKIGLRGFKGAQRFQTRLEPEWSHLSDPHVPRPSVLQRADLAEIIELVCDDNPLDELDAFVAELSLDPHS